LDRSSVWTGRAVHHVRGHRPSKDRGYIYPCSFPSCPRVYENTLTMKDHHDLSATLCAHLDKHLALAILEFLSARHEGTDEALAIEASKLELVEKTNMVDYAVDIYQQLHGTTEVRSMTTDASRRCVSCAALT
jgi:hypothetical protein